MNSDRERCGRCGIRACTMTIKEGIATLYCTICMVSWPSERDLAARAEWERRREIRDEQ